LSDVVGDDLSVIASGPTYPDDSTFADTDKILEKYQIKGRIPQAVLTYVERGLKGLVSETLKSDNPALAAVSNTIIGSNIVACRAAEKKALELGYNTLVLSDCLEGEARECAVFHAGIAQSLAGKGLPVKRPACVISGGENTVTLKGTGLGGRNQEFCLAIIPWISKLKEVGVLSAGTDGNDGPTDAAGGIVSSSSLGKATSLGLDVEEYLRNNDSYHFLEKLGALFKTGPTNTNVMDLRIVLVR
jgi:hydroxypyruvate reductase